MMAIHFDNSDKVLTEMLRRLIRSDLGQDLKHSADDRRHYNRKTTPDSDTDKQAAQEDYRNYIDSELGEFRRGLLEPSKRSCRASLRALGRLSHSWQDFFAHAIRKDGKGGREHNSPSGAEGWIAWSAGIRGDPGATEQFWPSSYSALGGGEHPGIGGGEPLVQGGDEWYARYWAAETYVRGRYSEFVPLWLIRCKCFWSRQDGQETP
jgi:hypothetical protein